jgi:hypothetical protein
MDNGGSHHDRQYWVVTDRQHGVFIGINHDAYVSQMTPFLRPYRTTSIWQIVEAPSKNHPGEMESITLIELARQGRLTLREEVRACIDRHGKLKDVWFATLEDGLTAWGLSRVNASILHKQATGKPLPAKRKLKP